MGWDVLTPSHPLIAELETQRCPYWITHNKSRSWLKLLAARWFLLLIHTKLIDVEMKTSCIAIMSSSCNAMSLHLGALSIDLTLMEGKYTPYAAHHGMSLFHALHIYPLHWLFSLSIKVFITNKI